MRLALALIFTVATQVAFSNGLILSFVYPLLAMALGTLGTLVILFVGEAIERERVRYVFSRFVPAGVVDEVLASTTRISVPGRGGAAIARCCFSDLRGFTTFSESQPAARVIEVVNILPQRDDRGDHGRRGDAHRVHGDGIMAIFGAPLEQEDHADRAIVAARRSKNGRGRWSIGWSRRGAEGEPGINGGLMKNTDVKNHHQHDWGPVRGQRRGHHKESRRKTDHAQDTHPGPSATSHTLKTPKAICSA